MRIHKSKIHPDSYFEMPTLLFVASFNFNITEVAHPKKVEDIKYALLHPSKLINLSQYKTMT